MTARDDILAAMRRPGQSGGPLPPSYVPPRMEDRLESFIAMASGAAAEVRTLHSADEIPSAVAGLLRAKNLPARIHLPPGSAFAGLGWSVACETTPPGPDDAAVAQAPFGIAETGTLAYLARPGEPASWHFRAGFEIAILQAGDIVVSMEDALARIGAEGLPPTLNFVTGPSRTGDIEQTLELGAHGPKALAILIVTAPPAAA